MSARVVAVHGNLVRAEHKGAHVRQNGIAEVVCQSGPRLLGEIIRVDGAVFDLQVFEDTRGVRVDDPVVVDDAMLEVELGPGLLGEVLDGLGTPLHALAKAHGDFLPRGGQAATLARDARWDFQPVVKVGDAVRAGEALGTVREGPIAHRIMAPLSMRGEAIVTSVAPPGAYTVDDTVAELDGNAVTMSQRWPIKAPLLKAKRRLRAEVALQTRARIVDAFFPIAEGGAACVPGPFGAGKTVLLQSLSKFADADVVIIAACGERAGEVTETLHELPQLKDPKSGRPLSERTLVICNTSSMPVAAREASVYLAMTCAEYYRQMGARVLLLADSTSRWAQALREMSGRLEEIPGEEAFPAYLSSRVAGFYERAGRCELEDRRLGKSEGSVTVVGTVSPAGGNFDEPVTRATLAVVGCFLGLTYARSYKKRFPAIAPLESWSRYSEVCTDALDARYGDGFGARVERLRALYARGQAVSEQLKVIGLEDVAFGAYLDYLRSELIDAAFLQQNAFSEVDAGPSAARTGDLLELVERATALQPDDDDKDAAERQIGALARTLRDLNEAPDGAAYDDARAALLAQLTGDLS